MKYLYFFLFFFFSVICTNDAARRTGSVFLLVSFPVTPQRVVHVCSSTQVSSFLKRPWKQNFTRLIIPTTVVPLHLCPLIADMSSDVMWYSGQSYPAIYRATRGLGLVKRLRCGYVFKQKYSFKGVGISGKFDQYFPVTDLRKTCCLHDHCEPDHWPLILLSLKFYRSLTQSDRIVYIT